MIISVACLLPAFSDGRMQKERTYFKLSLFYMNLSTVAKQSFSPYAVRFARMQSKCKMQDWKSVVTVQCCVCKQVITIVYSDA